MSGLINYTKSTPKDWPYHVRYRNPRYWKGEVESKGVKYFLTDSPEIYKAYLDAGLVPLEQYYGVSDAGTQEKEEEQKEQAVVPPDWPELSWPKMRSLACSLTDNPVPNKETAISVIEQYLESR